MSSILQSLENGDSETYSKSFGEQTKGGRIGLDQSERNFVSTAIDQKPQTYDAHKPMNYNFGGEQYIASIGVTISRDSHEHNILNNKLSDATPIKRVKGKNG